MYSAMGSWLNMAESVQRTVVRQALAGQHPQNTDELILWLTATVAGSNTAPTLIERAENAMSGERGPWHNAWRLGSTIPSVQLSGGITR